MDADVCINSDVGDIEDLVKAESDEISRESRNDVVLRSKSLKNGKIPAQPDHLESFIPGRLTRVLEVSSRY